MNAGEASRARATQEMSEDRFRLIVRGVGDGHAGDLAGGSCAFKKGVPQAASGILEIPVVFLCRGGHVLLLQNKFEMESAGEAGRKISVGIGFGAAQGVMKMQDVKCDAELVPESQ